MAEVGKLTQKQEKFCNEYLIDLNGSRAARAAGYSEATACSIGWENLRKPEIQQRIQELRDEMAKGLNITRERIAQEYARIAFFDIRKIFAIDGGLLPVREFGDDEAAVVAGIEVEEIKETDDSGDNFISGQIKKVKITDKRQALDSLVKLFGYAAAEKVDHTTNGKDISYNITLNLGGQRSNNSTIPEPEG